MDKVLILKKLEALGRCVERIEQRRPADAATLGTDLDLQDIITINLERAVQICVDIAAHLIADTSRPAPETMGECFAELRRMGVIDETLALRMQKAVAFRNIAVHEYQQIDWDVVFSIVSRHLTDFRQYAAAVIAHSGLG